MSNFEKTYTLVQQTPLIHFQHSEDGATLRATEVKPKLDRFLLKRLEAEGTNPPEDWFVKRDPRKGALDYKMRIEAVGPKETVMIGRWHDDSTGKWNTDYDIYYGNMGQPVEKQVKAVKYSSVRLKFVCFFPALREAIDRYLNDFFLVTNFGRMQSKGFGSFILSGDGAKSDEEAVAAALKREYQSQKVYYFKCNPNPFPQIKTVYSLMKTGINFGFRNQYRRSLLFRYMHEYYGIGNEKACLKQNRLAPTNVGQHAAEYHRNQQDEKSRYVRALMGTGDHVDFITVTGNPGSKKSVHISGPLERFPSTVFFKVINERVYYCGKRIDPEIFGKQFVFQSDISHTSVSISVPSTADSRGTMVINENFMDDFLSYCKDELNTNRPDDEGTPMRSFNGMGGVTIKEARTNE